MEYLVSQGGQTEVKVLASLENFWKMFPPSLTTSYLQDCGNSAVGGSCEHSELVGRFIGWSFFVLLQFRMTIRIIKTQRMCT